MRQPSVVQVIVGLVFLTLISKGQDMPVNPEIAFVSDTQAPMRVEKIFLKANHNTEATKLIFDDIGKRKPRALFILGDVVSLAFREKKWKAMDTYLEKLKDRNIRVYGLLGNHDVMGNARRGQRRFGERFPDQVNTGYTVIVDSVAVIMLNSNFGKLSWNAQHLQQVYYEKTLKDLDADPLVRFIIVTCHHAPYTNSRVVGSSVPVQQNFVPPYIASKKAKLFVTGHAHRFEWFQMFGKEFLTIGGGGGLRQPLNTGKGALINKATGYDPEFHYLTVRKNGDKLTVMSICLSQDFKKFETGFTFTICCSP